MFNPRRLVAVFAVSGLALGLSACSIVDAPKQAACDALYEKIDSATAQFSAQTGAPELSASDLQGFVEELETQNPEVAEQLREGNFSALLEGSGVDIAQLEEATGNSQLSELLTPENLAVLDGAGATLMSSVDQLQSLCGS